MCVCVCVYPEKGRKEVCESNNMRRVAYHGKCYIFFLFIWSLHEQNCGYIR